jgi:hypothetical protein
LNTLGVITTIIVLVLGRVAHAAMPSHGSDDSTSVDGVAAPDRSMPHVLFNPFSALDKNEFAFRHAFSLDHFLEVQPGFIIRRLGPIGAEVGVSRFGMGMGRGTLYIGNVSLNDPQTDRAPLAIVPTSAVGRLILDETGSSVKFGDSNIEGALQVIEPSSPQGKPTAAIELSKGTRGLRQRRVRFSTIRGTYGLDLSYDELRNDGYAFDTREQGVNEIDFGRHASRVQGMNIRGAFPGGEKYLFSFRTFKSDFTGDLVGPGREQQRRGHLAMFEIDLSDIRLTAYERGHKVSSPDSLTRNETTGVIMTLPIRSNDSESVSVAIGYEDILSRQEIGTGSVSPRLQRGLLGFAGSRRLAAGTDASFGLRFSHHFEMSSGWGVRFSLGRSLNAIHRISVGAKRSFRMPNLGELFLPVHPAGTSMSTRVAGNRYVKSEHGIEIETRLVSSFKRFQNEIGVTAIRVDDPIMPFPATIGSVNYLVPRNGAKESLGLVIDQFRYEPTNGGNTLRLTGGIEYAFEEGDEFFISVPRFRANAAVTVGRSFFKNTSELNLTAEYQYSSSRTEISGDELPAFSVWNFKLSGRLVDAHLYLMLLNALDEKYQTAFPYQMTPRTVVYGIEWTLFD